MSNRTVVTIASIVVATLFGAFAAPPVGATLIVTTKGKGNPGDNVISANCDFENDGPALIIDGCLNTDHSIDVQFEAKENIYFGAGGQAVILPEDLSGDGDLPGFNYLKISIVGQTFDLLSLNINAWADGTVFFANNLGDVSGSFALDGKGENRFDLSGDIFSWITLTSDDTIFDIGTKKDPKLVEDGNVQDTKQVRLQLHVLPDEANEVPEPGTIAMFSTGLVGLLTFGVFRRRRRTKA